MEKCMNFEETIYKVIKETIKEYDREKKSDQRDKRLFNTELLMKNYNKLKDHIDKVKDSIDIQFESEDERVLITSITRTKLRTMKMMGYIDSALVILEQRYKEQCEEYKYKAFKLFFIDKKTNEEIQEALSCGKNSPRIWVNTVLEELSVLLWGIEALGI